MPGQNPESRPLDIAATVVLLVVHAGLVLLTLTVLGFMVMGTDACSYRKCGDGAWISWAFALGFLGGGAVFVAVLVVSVVRLARQKLAFFLPIIGCVAQLALGVGAAAMETLAGPV